MYGYGTMIGIGLFAGWAMAEYRARRQSLAAEHVLHLVIWCAAGGFLGAKLLFLLTEWKTILQTPKEMIYMLADGFVVFGGILGGIPAGYLYCKKEGLSFLQWFDLLIPSVALGQGFGRIGCFLAGCCYGKATNSRFSVIFPASDYAPAGIALIPVQLYAAFLDFLLMGALLWIASRKKEEGVTAASYLILYSFGRFWLEFLRGDPERGMAGWLSTSQIISVLTFSSGLLLFLRIKRKKVPMDS